MRTLVVIDGAEVVEAALLLGERRRRRIGRFRLERAVQALEAAVLLRLARSIRSGLTPSLIHRAASCDSPPAPTEANGGPLSERIDSGSPNSQNAASKAGRTCAPSGSSTASQRNRKRLIPSLSVSGSQLFVASAKPALEIGAPCRVGRVDRLERRRKRRTAPARPPRLRQPLLAQPVADRAPRRRRLLGKTLAKLPAQLLGTPVG